MERPHSSLCLQLTFLIHVGQSALGEQSRGAGGVPPDQISIRPMPE